jgi:DNA-binding NtrC family response regulator
LELRGNVTELDTIVTAALIAVASSCGGTGLIGRACIELASNDVERKEQSSIGSGLPQDLSEGSFMLEGLNERIYDEAMGRCNGNVAAAARLLGISRAQLAYRLRRKRSKNTAPNQTGRHAIDSE